VAKKSRTPPPPRRTVQAPRKRGVAPDPRRTRLWLAALAGVLLIAGAIVGIALAVGGGGDDEAGGAIAVGQYCTEQSFPNQGQQHSPPYEIPAGFKYNSNPPTSGPHDPSPAIWDVYESPVDEKKLIHNLEHGGIVVQYGDQVPPAQLEPLLQWYREDPDGIIVAPLPGLGDRIAATAWEHLLSCAQADPEALSQFRDKYRFKGPETGFAAEYYQPGNG
jgi:hypothetical protein